MVDLATLGIKIDSSQIKDADASLEKFQKSAAGAERAAGGFSKAGAEASSATRQLASDVNDAERAASNLGSKFARGFAIGGVVASIGALGAAFKDAFDWATKTADQMKLLGMSAKDFQNTQNAFALGGVNNSTFNAGTSALGSTANKEFREGEGELTSLLEANNLKITDRQGKLKSVNDLLMDGAKLVSEAGSEFDKIDIAKILGLSEDWVKVLEQGPEALRKAIGAAEESGSAIDRELIQRAKDFEKWWNEAVTNFGIWFKATMADLVPVAQHLGQLVANIMNPMATFKQGAAMMRETLARGAGLPFANETALRNRDEQMTPKSVSDGLVIDMKPRRKTVIPTSGGGGGGGGRSPAEERDDAFEREIRRMQERTKLINEQTEVVGLGTFAREQQIQVQRLLNAAEREGYEVATRYKDATDLIRGSTEGLTPAMAAQREQILSTARAYAEAAAGADQAKEAQARIDEVRSLGASTFKGFISDLRSGKSVMDSFSNALNKIADKLLDMAVNDIFASAFGGRGGKGGGGGFFSSLFGGGGGGGAPVNLLPNATGNAFSRSGVISSPTVFPFAKGTGLMGEAGPEAIMPLKRGANGALGVQMHGGGQQAISQPVYAPVYHIDARGADQAAVARIERGLAERDRSFNQQVAAVNRSSQVRKVRA